MDRLTLLLSQFPITAGVFHTGALVSAADFPPVDAGHLHLFREGEFYIYMHGKPDIHIEKPTLLYCPIPIHHRLSPVGDSPSDVICANISLGDNESGPIADSLPEVIVLPLERIPSLAQVLEMLFHEASQDRCGKQVAQDRLIEYFLVLLLRELIEQNVVNSGLLAGLADKQLAKVIVAIQASPSDAWTVETMAGVAGMSRARFAARFKDVLGMTPHQYLTDWRIALAQTRLRRGDPLQVLAVELGYSNSAAFARAFQQRVGMTPKVWLKSQLSSSSAHIARDGRLDNEPR